jgi:thiopeptide-type bacteriocin biosynthesis protein
METRAFYPGDKWIYFQIYCSTAARDRLIGSLLKNFSEELYAEQIIEKWFFIRYDTPSPHLRARYLAKSGDDVFQIISLFNSHARPWIDKNLIWRVTLDTYIRELERYDPFIKLAEDIFCLESNYVCNLLSEINTCENKEELKWRLFLTALSLQLDDFALSIQSRREFARASFENFMMEMGNEKTLKIAVDGKYRLYKNEINSLFSLNSEHNINPYRQEIIAVSEGRRRLIANAGYRQASKDRNYDFIGSLAHMFANRVFANDHRLHELVMYSFLFRKYSYEMNFNKTPV